MKKNLIVLKLLFCVGVITAQTKIAHIFTNHMVLQRNTQVAVWGTDKPHAKVVIKAGWGEKVSVETNKQGKWKTFIQTIGAGGPYELSIKGSSKVEFKDILLGEVWVCSGQSNMSMSLEGNMGQPVYGSQKTILNSNNDNIRLYTVERNTSAEPREVCNGEWVVSEPHTAKDFSAVAYFFGRLLNEKLNVPIGLIHSSWGGTPAQAWTPEETLRAGFKEFYNQAIMPKQESKKNARLFNAMINPIIPYTIKGTIWYQGEGNRFNAEQYSRLFPAMINSWRNRWGQGDFPFYFVQIASFGPGKEHWVELQESQLKTMLTVEKTGMVVTNDIGQENCIHPPKKREVGERLAYWALSKDYGCMGIQFSGPVYKSMELKEGKAYLHFDYAPLGVTNMEKPLNDFEIAGADKVYKTAQAKIIKGQLEVWSDEIMEPVHVRYGWKCYFEPSLFNTAGLPASGFRTEAFE
ncbi:sialate O-acetylesterase [Saccharicrinis sp. 156]|uniref:sialate O-acetylesterase n=1 Tax=Saccharicrinis sp. 156 TaxID=3417574 RepID=UPI003D34AB86